MNAQIELLQRVYYAKAKSSLDRKRVKTDPAFRETMRYAGLLGKAATIASVVYRSLPEEKKVHGYYRKLTGQAMRLLKENKTAEEVLKLLQPGKIKKIIVATVFKNTVEEISFADKILMQVFAETMHVKEECYCRDVEAPP